MAGPTSSPSATLSEPAAHSSAHSPAAAASAHSPAAPHTAQQPDSQQHSQQQQQQPENHTPAAGGSPAPAQQQQKQQQPSDHYASAASPRGPPQQHTASWTPTYAVLCGESSLPGSRYGALNQDFVITRELHDARHLRKHRWPQCYLTCVLDGHGMLGELAAQEAGKAIMHSMQHSELRHRQLADLSVQQVEGVMRAAFREGHLAALRVFDHAPRTYVFPLGASHQQRYTLREDPHTGDKVYTCPHLGARMLEFGTTATLALVQGTTLVVAGVGDSLAVLGREQGEEYWADTVSTHHSGWDPGEQRRLQEECGDAVSIDPQDGYLTVQEGRLRGFQLAMTRAIGHRLLSAYGVSATPTVSIHSLHPEHICLIAATDGVWEVLSPAEAVKCVCDALAEGRDAASAAHALCHEAVRLASTGPVRAQTRADNTTCSVLVLAEL